MNRLHNIFGVLLLFAVFVFSIDGFADEIEFPPEIYVSNTLPVVYINTKNNAPIISKDEYIEATCYIDASCSEEYSSMGDEYNQISLQIKGRGNTSWSKPKKPYRLKFDEKVSPLGLKKNRHFILGSEWVEGQGRINWETGFYVCKLMGLSWTPAHIPVELVLNGEYLGLYFLVEKIRVGTHRVNIVEQDNEETIPEKVTGGWLCEIDNYIDEPQISLRDRTTGKYIRTTVHSPDVLSDVQKSYIKNHIKNIDDAIYCRDKTSTEWEKYIDLDDLVRYYLVCEVINQIEGFSGSCYWWKDRGEDTKIHFGPAWDFDTSNLMWETNKFFYENNNGDEITDRNHWIMEIAKYPRFQQRVREIWQEYCNNSAALVEPHALNFVEKVRAAAASDIARWKSFYYDPTMKNTTLRSNRYLERLKVRHEWLCEQWEKPIPIIGDADGDSIVTENDLNLLKLFLLDQQIDTLNIENANTYNDEVINLCDLVGILRILYRQHNPTAVIPYPPSVPYGVDDLAISDKVVLTIKNLPLNNVWFPGMKRSIGICANGISQFSAFSVDLSTSNPIKIKGIYLNGIEDANYHIYEQRIDTATTRILGYSDNLLQFNLENEAFLLLELEMDKLAAYNNNNYISISNVLLANNDMYPTRIDDMYIPINVHALKGDVDGNNIIDVVDVNAIINIILKLNSASNYIIANADVNGDERIDIEDVNAVINMILFH